MEPATWALCFDVTSITLLSILMKMSILGVTKCWGILCFKRSKILFQRLGNMLRFYNTEHLNIVHLMHVMLAHRRIYMYHTCVFVHILHVHVHVHILSHVQYLGTCTSNYGTCTSTCTVHVLVPYNPIWMYMYLYMYRYMLIIGWLHWLTSCRLIQFHEGPRLHVRYW